MFPQVLQDKASQVLAAAHAKGVRIATAETCTGGLLSACLTSVPGASAVFERGFALYHESAKATGLDVPEAISRTHGAVSAEVTVGLAEGALKHSAADVCRTPRVRGRPRRRAARCRWRRLGPAADQVGIAGQTPVARRV